MDRDGGQPFEPFLNPYTGKAEEVRSIVEPALDAMGCELVLMHLIPGQHRTTVRFFVDKKPPERGIELSTLEKVNRSLGDLLDVEDTERKLFKGAWDLEVSSPGVDRPLAKRSHFEQALGERVKLKSRRPVEGSRRTLTGALKAASEEGPQILVDGGPASGEPVQLTWDDVEDAHVVFEFNAKPKPKGKGKARKTGAGGKARGA